MLWTYRTAVDVSRSVAGCRSRFPIFERLTYLNSCSQGALSDAVRAAYGDYLTDWDEKGAPWEYWMERTESARSSFAGLVGADDDEVAVTASVPVDDMTVGAVYSPAEVMVP